MENRLRLLRTIKEAKQEEIANLLGTSQQQYSLYENGTRELKANQIRILCEYYDVSADYIIGLSHQRRFPKW